MQKLIFIPAKHLNIKNIIFDLGGVILNIDYNLTFQEFKRLGFENFDDVFKLAKQTGLFNNLDKGLISPQEFRNEIRLLAKKPLTDQQIDKAWNSLLLDFPIPRLKVLESVHKSYRTFLLSNTNQIHCEVYNRDLQKTYGVSDLSYFFEKLYYSHEIHMIKPDREAFQIILDQNQLHPEETLFIDDTEHHVEGARAVGINAYYLKLKEGETIEGLFQVV